MVTKTVTSISKLVPLANASGVGDIILLADGTYDHPSRESISKSGVIVKAANKGKAIIKGAPIDITGTDITFDGFELQYSTTEQTVVSLRGSKFKFINNKCPFKNATTNRSDWFVVKASDGLFQGNDVYGKVGQGKMLYVGPGTVLKNVKVLNNKLHDHSGGSGNGAELVGIGASPVMKEVFNVEFAGNEIYNFNTSDDELLSIKSSGNDIHDNLFRNNRGSPCFRHGRFNKFRNNKLEGTGIRIYGKGHEITGNNFKRNSNKQLLQIVVGNGMYAEEEQNTTAGYTQVRDLIFQNNYIDMQDSTSDIIFCFGYGSHPLKPTGNKVIANTIMASSGTLANTNDGASWTGNTLAENIFWPAPNSTARLGNMPTTAFSIKDPNAVVTPPPEPEPEPTPEPPPTMTLEEQVADHERRIKALENA